MSERILLVDDEPAVLDAYRRLLHKEFAVHTTVGAGEALEAIALAREDPFAVVVSDLRMPEMDGVQFLSRVRVVSPDTVRIALTGQADIQTAVSAVNEGSLFRFLTKPCDKDVLAKALTAGLVQYRLVIAEKELLEKTLHGSVTVLTEVLSLVNPAAFSRAIRIRRYVQHVVKKLQLEGAWRFDVAAMMSQLGCVTLDTETLEAIYAGQRLSPEEQARVDAHPGVAANLLSNIPRLEPVARMIALQDSVLATGTVAVHASPDVVTLGAQILKVALSYDQLRNGAISHQDSLSRLRLTPQQFERSVVDALEDLEMDAHRVEVKNCRIAELECGMILQEDVRTQNGLLVVAKGQQITYPLLIRLRNFWQRKAIAPAIVVHIPRGATQGETPRPEGKKASAAS